MFLCIAQNRPKREVRSKQINVGSTSESLQLHKCVEFVGQPGSGAALAQPYSVTVKSQVCTHSCTFACGLT